MKAIAPSKMCVVGTVYAYLLYLLYNGNESFEDTVFYFEENIPDAMKKCCRFWNSIPARCPLGASVLKNIIHYVKCKRLGSKIAPKSEVLAYAQDHLRMAPFLLRNKDYVLIADGPLCYSINELYHNRIMRKWDSVPYRILKMLLGAPSIWRIGRFNKHCKGIILERPDSAGTLNGLPSKIVNLRDRWKDLDSGYRERILETFQMDYRDIVLINDRETVVFTQPFCDDGCISEKEQVDIYRHALEQYDPDTIVIKRHPRDKIDYEKYFPGCKILNSAAPFQLFVIMGCEFKRAITVSSSAIASLPDAEIVWLSNSIDHRIAAKYGNQDALYLSIIRNKVSSR